MYVLNITVSREVFEKFPCSKLFLVKFQTFPFQVSTFQAILPGILILNSQTRHFPWSVIQKALKFQIGNNSSRWSLYADSEIAFEMLQKIGAFKTFAKLTGKNLRQSNFNVYKLIAWGPSNVYLIKVSSRNTRKRCETCSKFWCLHY